MLYLIGLGLADDDITVKALRAMKKCDAIYCEFYTNKWMGDLKKLEKNVKKEINILPRENVESDFLIKEAQKKDVALLVSGDPLTATTHFELVLQARLKGIGCEIVHAPSIYTAVADTGLQLYKFGRTTTLVYQEKNFLPSSPYDVVAMNKSIGLHTLVLLDVKKKKQMTLKDALNLLLKIESEKKKHVISKQTNVLACCRLGGKDAVIKYDTVENIIKDRSVQKTPAVLVITGTLNFKEEEALDLWK
ncbi:MAG: diphthine synthase [Candidatus Aenigmarchaeota archaeon]|nr:diphthine synthase [Candidatus Aenigmarchaeota archaeon]